MDTGGGAGVQQVGLSCADCQLNLTGHRYIVKDEKPHCIKCYEQIYSNECFSCKQKIGTDAKDLSYKERHWHEQCFKCQSCSVSLGDKSFASKDDAVFCPECYDNNFALRCDACGNVFKGGMKKYEFQGKNYHEECFLCKSCMQPIGVKTFIPKDNQPICVPCYEEKFAQKCVHCTKVINKGGLIYKETSWHKECFTCTNCNKQLAGEKFTSQEDKPYCAECFAQLFAKKCCRCTKPVTGLGTTKFISFDDRHWHNECFQCYKCTTPLVGRGFLVNGLDIHCPNCAKA